MTGRAHRHWSVHPTRDVAPLDSATPAGGATGAPVSSLVRQQLLALGTPQSHPRGAEIAREGEVGDAVHLVLRGSVRYAVSDGKQAVLVSELRTGDLFGESCVLDEHGCYDLTATAVTTVQTLRIPAEDLRGLINADGALAEDLRAAADHLHLTRFLRLLSPFAKVEGTHLERLAAALRRKDFRKGQAIARPGETVAECLLLGSGTATVARGRGRSKSADSRTLHPGALFGETALLAGSTDDVTVRALERCTVYAIDRDVLLDALRSSRAAAFGVMQLAELDARPGRADGVTFHPAADQPGIVGVLKNEARGTYFQLSALGQWLWEHLDGERTVRELVLDAFYGAHVLDPSGVARMIAGLADGGFLVGVTPPAQLGAELVRLSGAQRGALAIRRALEWRWSVAGVDPAITTAYRDVVRRIFTRTGAVVSTLLGIVGVAAFVAARPGPHQHTSGPLVVGVIFAGYLLSILVHEAGHAFATKAAGREVLRVGVGWYWFGPVAFVDTSDVWLATRAQRLLVSLAGPLADLLLGGVFAVAAWFAAGAAAVVLWELAALSYLAVALNLNPLMEYDGYYTLMDFVRRPNLRAEALGWMRTGLPQVVRRKASLRGHGLDLAYGLGSLLYVAGMCVLTVVVYRATLQKWITHLGAPTLATVLAWVATVAVAAFCVVGALEDMRGPAAN